MSFCAFVIYLLLAVFVSRNREQKAVHRVFTHLCLLFSIYSFCYGFVFSAADIHEYEFWYRLSMFGWLLMPGAVLHFFLLLTGSIPRQRNRRMLTYVGLYLPGFVMLCRGVTGNLTASAFVRAPWGFTGLPNNTSPWYWAFMAYYLITCGGAILLSAYWGLRRHARKRERLQSLVITSTALISFVGSGFSNLVFPLIGWKDIPVLAPVNSAIWLVGIWFAIVRYGFLEFTPAIASEEVLARVTDMILLVDSQGSIVRANIPVAQLLGYRPEEMVGLPILYLIEQSSALSTVYGSAESGQVRVRSDLRARDGRRVPVVLMPSRVENEQGEGIGFVVVAQDIEFETRVQSETLKKGEQLVLLREQNESLTRMIREKKSELDRRLSLLERETEERRKMRDLYNQYDFLVNTSAEWMALVGRDMRLSAVNDAVCRAFDMKREAMEGSSLSDYWEAEPYRQKVVPPFQRAFRGELVNIRTTLSIGHYFSGRMKATLAPFRDFSGEVTHVAVLARVQKPSDSSDSGGAE